MNMIPPPPQLSSGVRPCIFIRKTRQYLVRSLGKMPKILKFTQRQYRFTVLKPRTVSAILSSDKHKNNLYYMHKGILLATKTLLESISHYNRDPSSVFSVLMSHSRLASINPAFFTVFVFKMADEFRVCGVERRRHLPPLRATRKCCLLVSACYLLFFIVNA